MLEKRFIAVPPQLFTADGNVNGQVEVADTSLFKVKQQVVVIAAGQPNLEVEIKRVDSPTVMFVGPKVGNIDSRVDLTDYTIALAAFVFSNEQKRPSIPLEEFTRAKYEEEPVVAERVVLVDKMGNKYDYNNPLPVDANVTIGGIVVDIDAFKPQADSVLVVGTEDGTTTGTKHVIKVAEDGSVQARNWSSLVPEPKTRIQIVSRTLDGDIAVARFYNGATVICDLQLSYDINGDLSDCVRV